MNRITILNLPTLEASLWQQVYACGLKDGVTKIGHSSRTAQRLLHHNARQIEWLHLSVPVAHGYGAERVVLQLAKERGSLIDGKKEEFFDLPKHLAIRCVHDGVELWQSARGDTATALEKVREALKSRGAVGRASKITGVSPRTLQRFVAGLHTPRHETVIKLERWATK